MTKNSPSFGKICSRGHEFEGSAPCPRCWPGFYQKAYDQLAFYTLAQRDPAFIHQHIVDAFAAQMANEKTKPIKLSFGLIGLYLMLEKGYTGKQVQLAHMELAQQKREWPQFSLPRLRGPITVKNVMAAPPGPERDDKILEWCASVWAAYADSHEKVRELARMV